MSQLTDEVSWMCLDHCWRWLPGAMLAVCLLGPTVGLTEEEVVQGDADEQARIGQLIEQLGDDEFQSREAAQAALEQFGFAAFDALEEAVKHEDLEIASRAKYLMRWLETQWVTGEDSPEVTALLSDYSRLAFEQRSQRINALAELDAGIGMRALCRLIRFERHAFLSKKSAAAVILWEPPDEASQQRITAICREELADSQRAGARWLLAHFRCREDPEAGLIDFEPLVETQVEADDDKPTAGSQNIDTVLLYRLAQIQKRLGRVNQAEETALRAFEQSPRPRDPRNISVSGISTRSFAHSRVSFLPSNDFQYSLAKALQWHGMFDWAEREYLRIAETTPALGELALMHATEMRHDQGRDDRAAELFDFLAASYGEMPKPIAGQLLERVRKQFAPRRHYFLACHAARWNDPAAHRKHLDEAIQHDEAEVDVLIARYRLTDRSDEYHKRTLDLIGKAIVAFQKQVAANAQDPTPSNTCAWLIANTEGDLDEALSMSKRSLKLLPNTAAYYDTLGIVYFARGEYESALRCQTNAIRLEPHSGLIARQYKRFRLRVEEVRAEKADAGEAP